MIDHIEGVCPEQVECAVCGCEYSPEVIDSEDCPECALRITQAA